MSEKTESKGWCITPDGEKVNLPEPANEDGTYTLDQLQEAVGGYIEEVRAHGAVLEGRVILVDEEGLLKQLPINLAGTVICGRPIVGNVVVIREEAMK